MQQGKITATSKEDVKISKNNKPFFTVEIDKVWHTYFGQTKAGAEELLGRCGVGAEVNYSPIPPTDPKYNPMIQKGKLLIIKPAPKKPEPQGKTTQNDYWAKRLEYDIKNSKQIRHMDAYREANAFFKKDKMEFPKEELHKLAKEILDKVTA